jgi:hypothetical protein
MVVKLTKKPALGRLCLGHKKTASLSLGGFFYKVAESYIKNYTSANFFKINLSLSYAATEIRRKKPAGKAGFLWWSVRPG